MASEYDGDDQVSRLQVDIEEEIKTAAKIEALKKGVTLSEFVETALREYLKKTQSKR